MAPKLSLIVAACQISRGIGINGSLPWRLPGDMAFFKKITSETLDPGKQNVVIMGRKTWDSIPEKFRPLPNRINIVISNTLRSLPSGAHVADSLNNAIKLVSSSDLYNSIENIFIIGGSSIYQMALESPYCYRIYLTEVIKEFECDTFLPQFDEVRFKPIKLPGISTHVHEGETPYKFTVYQSVIKTENSSPSSSDIKPFVYISVAMDLNRGFGKDGSLPWPHIKKDFDHYISLLSTSNSAKKVVSICGRKTWESMNELERSLNSVFHIVISKIQTLNTLRESTDAHFVAESFNIALDVAIELCKEGKTENICILGGLSIYEEAIRSPYCQRIFLTRILQEFKCDVFFPKFEDKFRLAENTRENENSSQILEENGVTFKFEEYERFM